jgi:uncharacterized radical SAM superfamily Fe-S cluster-containing enzyme
LIALENIRKYTKTKIIIMYVMAKGINDRDLDVLFQFLHDRSDFISAIDFVPITPTWPSGRLPEIEAERTTIEDVEDSVDETFSAGKVEFLPAGVFDNPLVLDFLNIKSNPFQGIHPNCESFSLLISDGRSYVPLSLYLRRSMFDIARKINDGRRLTVRLYSLMSTGKLAAAFERIRLKTIVRNIAAAAFVANVLFRYTKLDRITGTKGLNAGVKTMKILAKMCLGYRTTKLLREYTALKNVFRIVVLPFEDDARLESARLERCSAAFAYIDFEKEMVRTIPGCAWGHYKNRVLAQAKEHYVSGVSEPQILKPETRHLNTE